MVLEKLKYQSKLTVTELDTFLSEFLTLYRQPVDEPVTEVEALEEIYLSGKESVFENVLNDFKKCIKRVRKMPQTMPLGELDTKRIMLLSGIITFIRSCKTETDANKVEAYWVYEPLLEQFRNYHKESNASQSSIIRKFIAAVKEDTYANAFTVLNLQARVDELESVNEEYIALSDARSVAEKNVPDSPSKVRKVCIAEYHNLVNLVNLAVKMNKAYLYEEKRNELAALTQKTQELVNRRMKKKEEKPETPEGTTGEDVAPDTVSAV